MAIALGVVVIATLLALLVARNVTVQVNPEEDYANLVPAPDSVEWRVGDQRTVWLSTNRRYVDMRVDSIGLGPGTMRGRGGGQILDLGHSIGCVNAVVSGIAITNLSADSGLAAISVDYGSYSPGDTLRIYYRIYRTMETRRTANILGALVTVPSSGALTYTINLSAADGPGRYYIDASLDGHFPAITTQRVYFLHRDGEDPSVTVSREDEMHLLKDTGIELAGCHERGEVLVTLHGDGGGELNRYFVDVLEAATPTPVPTAVVPPDFGADYAALRFCADAATPRGSVLSGGEEVGTLTGSGGPGLVYSLGGAGDDRDYAFFEIDASTGSITVSDLGADDTTGMDGTRLYSFSVQATDDGGLTGEATVAAQLNLTSISTGGDGSCP